MKKFFILLVSFILCILFFVQTSVENPHQNNNSEVNMSLILTSDAFKHNERIPDKYTCSGSDTSPALKWHGAPSGTKSFALIMDDPDAPVGTWDHWVLYYIPGHLTQLDAGKIDSSIKSANNSWKKQQYGGPCPPPGKDHRYFFKLYALDDSLKLPVGADKQSLLEAMNGHILSEATLIGIYSRK